MSKGIPWDLGLAGMEMLNIICDKLKQLQKYLVYFFMQRDVWMFMEE